MLIESLKIFCDIADLNSFSRAAERNYVTQSSVSQQVRKLETHWKTRLINREKRSVSLTREGEVLYAKARSMLERYDEINRFMGLKSKTVSGSVKVAAIHGVGLHELPPYLKRFIQLYPEVKVHLEYKKDHQVYDEVLRRNADIGIVAYPKARPGLKVIPFREDELGIVCSPTHPLGKKSQAKISDLDGENFVAFEKNLPTRRAVDDELKKHGASVNVVMEFDNIETVKRAVEIGAGISILPLVTVNNELDRKALRTVKISGKPLARPLGILILKKRSESVPVARFTEILTDLI